MTESAPIIHVQDMFFCVTCSTEDYCTCYKRALDVLAKKSFSLAQTEVMG